MYKYYLFINIDIKNKKIINIENIIYKFWLNLNLKYKNLIYFIICIFYYYI